MRFAILSILAILLAGAFQAPAQILSFGVKAGVPIASAPFQTGGSVDTGRWTIGPVIELRLTSALSIEAEALYRAYNLTGQGSVITSGSDAGQLTILPYRYEVKAWDFPVLLKYRFLKGRTRPFINAGAALTHESADVTSSCSGPACSNLGFFNLPAYIGHSTFNSNRPAEVAGGGVEFRYGRIRIAPEVRYAHLYRPEGNQVTLQFGVLF